MNMVYSSEKGNVGHVSGTPLGSLYSVRELSGFGAVFKDSKRGEGHLFCGLTLEGTRHLQQDTLL
jgi:hypothetical protein